MATKKFHADMHDNGLQHLIDLATAGDLFKTIVEGDPSTYEHAQSEKGTGAGMRVLAEVAIAPGDLTLQNVGAAAGSFAGREVLVAASAGVNVAASSTGDLAAVLYSKATGQEALLYVTEETSDQPLTSGNTATIPQMTVRYAATVT